MAIVDVKFFFVHVVACAEVCDLYYKEYNRGCKYLSTLLART